MKKLVLTIGLFILTIGLSACQNVSKRANTVDTWKQIEQKRQVIVGVDDSFVPMDFEQKNGQLTGYDVDLARAVFKHYGIKVNFQTIDWSMNATELRNGTIDFIWNGYSITPQRQKKVAFSLPYLRNKQVLVVKKNSKIQAFNEMADKTLGMQTASTDQQWYEGKQEVFHAKNVVLYDQIPNAFLDLNANRIQGILLDEVYANYYLAHLAHANEYTVLSNKKVSQDLFAVGMRKGDVTLRKKINSALKLMQRNGELRRLNKKWFGVNSNYIAE